MANEKASSSRASGGTNHRSLSVESDVQGFGGSSKPEAVKGSPSTLLQEGDGLLLSLTGAFKRMRIDQVARFTGESLSRVRRRVLRLESESWLEKKAILGKEKEDELWTIWSTGAGLEAVGLKASFYRGLPSLANISHDFSLVEIGLALIGEDPDGVLIPERLVGDAFGYGREHVWANANGEVVFEGHAGDGAGDGRETETKLRRTHRPDGVFVRGDGSLVIVECETSTKTRDLREWMMLQNEGYVVSDEGVVGIVHYYGLSPDVRSRVQLTQEERGLRAVAILETPGEILWPAGTRINK